MKINHKEMALTDLLFLTGELEHMRRHAILAAANAPEEETISLLVLASKCQEQRRKLMKKYFNVEERHWCIVKSAARLLQLIEETAEGDLDEIKDLKYIVDDAIMLATNEDISGCESCREDANT